MKLAALMISLAILIALISVVSLAQGKKNSKPSKTLVLENPLENSDRIEVGLLPSGKYRLNKEGDLNLQELGDNLFVRIAGRPADRKAVIFHAPPEAQYGEVIRVLDAVNRVGAMPIIPYVKTQEEIVKFSLVTELNRGRNITVAALPSAASASDDVYLQNALSVVVTIPSAGVYFVGEKEVKEKGKASEQELAALIRAGLAKLGPEIPHNVYVRCLVNAPYSDVSLLTRAISKAGAEAVMLVTVKK